MVYAKIVPVAIAVSSPEVAEAAKILENTYRAVNIALVNELKVLYTKMGIDIWEVINAAKTKPFGYQAFYPGPGLGGHCIPIDPFYLTWIARKYDLSTRFIELAGEINTSMPDYVIARLIAALNDVSKSVRNSNVLLLGAAYKPNVDDPRESPFFNIFSRLRAMGAHVEYCDPHIPVLPSIRHYPDVAGIQSRVLSRDYVNYQDIVVIVTDHDAFDWVLIRDYAALILDTRNAMQRIFPDTVSVSGRIIKA